jgi:SWI/SNF-related matrix-associated actin-dependent regulator of chromatin subfamily A member 5
MLRRLKVDVEKSLMPKIETLLYVQMTDMQRELYKGILRRCVRLLGLGLGLVRVSG